MSYDPQTNMFYATAHMMPFWITREPVTSVMARTPGSRCVTGSGAAASGFAGNGFAGA